MEKILNYGRHLIDEEDIKKVVSVLRGELITQGPLVEQFERELARRVKARFAVAVTSGTAGLHVACLAAGLKPGDIGITSAMTFAASANAINYCGAEVKLCDINKNSLCMDPNNLAQIISEQPNASVIIPVHFGGLPADMKKIRALAGDRVIIEDAAHALGANYSCGRPVGCGEYADMTVFSFHPVKPITTGEGGIIVTNNSKLAYQLKLLRTHGIEKDPDLFENVNEGFENSEPCTWYYEQQHLGFNYRMTDIQAALGLSQLNKLDQFINKRRSIAGQYDDVFSKFDNINRPQSSSKSLARSGNHLYILEFNFKKLNSSRSDIIKKLQTHNIGSQVHYIPIYKHPFHARKLNVTADEFRVTEEYYQKCLSIPLYPGMSDQDIEHVKSVIKEIINT
jgi:perosamine synthetase